MVAVVNHSITDVSDNGVVAETNYQRLEVLLFTIEKELKSRP